MRFAWRCVLVVAALMAGSLLVTACGGEEEPKDSFPDMTPPAGGKGGIRGHMHGGLTEAFVCGEEWGETLGLPTQIDLGEEGTWALGMFDCPDSAWNASIDNSRNDLFLFDGLESGDYWLIGYGESYPAFYRFGKHGHRVTVKEGQWTDVESLEVKAAVRVRFGGSLCASNYYSQSVTAEALGPTNIASVRFLIDGEAYFDSGDISARHLQAYEAEGDTEVSTGTHTHEIRVEGTDGAQPYVEREWIRTSPTSCASGPGEPPSAEP